MKFRIVVPIIAGFLFLNAFAVLAVCNKTRILPVGDSITVGVGDVLDNAIMVGYRRFLWEDLLANNYAVDFVGSQNSGNAIPGFDYNHEGHSGWTADMAADHIYQWLIDNPADIILLHIGTNDIGLYNNQIIVNNVDHILDLIDNYEAAYNKEVTVILAKIINRTQYSSLTTSFNTLLQNLVANRQATGDQIVLVDMENALVYPDDMYDLLHPNSSGYAKMSDIWFSVLGEILFTCTETGNQAPNGMIDITSQYVTIYAGESVVFTGTGSDPNNSGTLSYLWHFGAGSGVPNSTLNNPGSVQFNVPGTYTVSFTVTDALGLSDPTPAIRVITVKSSSPVIPQAGWSLRYVDSQEISNWAATKAFDGNPNTFWHTQFQNGVPPLPHEIQIDLGQTYSVDGFRYLPRQDAYSFGTIGQYEFYVSSDGMTWVSAATGTFANSRLEKEVTFASKVARFIRLKALSEVNGILVTSMAEINVLGSVSSPNGVIDSPTGNVTINVGDRVSFAGTGSDPDGNLPLTYLWQFGAGSGVPNSTLQNPGSVQFNVTGTYTVSFTVTDALGLSDPTPATRVVTVQSSSPVIPQAGWSLKSVDSQEISNWAATKAFDGNPNTFWHTQFQNGVPPLPHEIQIDLGQTCRVDGFRYLPRQDAYTFGTIGQYEFYVSPDGTTWGSPVTGTFANSRLEKEVTFAPSKVGRFIRLKALSEVNGVLVTSMAEINVLGSVSSPNGVIDSPTGNVTINVGDWVSFSGTGSDPDGNLPLTYLWQFGAGSGISNSTLQNPGSMRFNVPGSYTVNLTVTDALGLSDPTPATRVVTVQSSSPVGVIPQAGWSLRYVDSQEISNWAATKAFDGNPNTFWHTQFQNGVPPLPHEIQIDLGQTCSVDGFRYLPRQDAYTFGTIGQYEFYVSPDGTTWGSPVTGTFANSRLEKEVTFAPSKVGRFIRLKALSEVNGVLVTSMAEINVLGSVSSPNGVIDSPTGNVTINVGDRVSFAGTGSDPDGNIPLTYLWQFGAGSGVPNSTSQNPGSVQFNVPGTYTVSFTVTDALGLSDPTPATRVVTVQSSSPVIPQAGWSLKSVDSQEISNWAATKAFDGNPNTFWHTQFQNGVPPLPHEIQIDLGQTYSVNGFRYLPRQDAYTFGTIGQYEFYVSADGTTWGSPVTGTFANSRLEKEVTFAPSKVGRFIRLKALSEVNGVLVTSMAEINILGN